MSLGIPSQCGNGGHRGPVKPTDTSGQTPHFPLSKYRLGTAGLMTLKDPFLASKTALCKITEVLSHTSPLEEDRKESFVPATHLSPGCRHQVEIFSLGNCQCGSSYRTMELLTLRASFYFLDPVPGMAVCDLRKDSSLAEPWGAYQLPGDINPCLNNIIGVLGKIYPKSIAKGNMEGCEYLK